VLAFSAIAGKRVYIDYLKVEELIPIMYRVVENNYPKPVGNTTTYTITGLNTDSTYYFTIKPQGITNPTESNQIKAHTDITTNTARIAKRKVAWNVQSSTLNVQNIPKNAYLTLYNASGQIIQAGQHNSPLASIHLSKPGFYFLKVADSNSSEIIKIFR
jgi:hypothetical protein